MGDHIVHLVNDDYYLSLNNNHLVIKLAEREVQTLPLEDIAAVVIASPRITLTSLLLASLAENKVPVVVCGRDFTPASITLPCYEPTHTETVRMQVESDPALRAFLWRRIVAAKVDNQRRCLLRLGCGDEGLGELVKNAASVSADASAIEATAAKRYWPVYFAALGAEDTRRVQRTREGLNGKLDYGYTVMRAMALRALAAVGLIAALGLGHVPRRNQFALADDLMEPFRPFVDLALFEFSAAGGEDHTDWAKRAAALLFCKVTHDGRTVDIAQSVLLCAQRLALLFKSPSHGSLNFPSLDALE